METVYVMKEFLFQSQNLKPVISGCFKKFPIPVKCFYDIFHNHILHNQIAPRNFQGIKLFKNQPPHYLLYRGTFAQKSGKIFVSHFFPSGHFR